MITSTMSEAEQLFLPFDTQDITTNASENNVDGPQTAIMALADQLDFVDPSLFGAGTGYFDETHYIAEIEQAQKRRVWLEQADVWFRSKDYASAISLLKDALADIEHAHYYSEALQDVLRDIIEQCRALPTKHAIGHVSVAQVVAFPTDVEPASVSIHPIAS